MILGLGFALVAALTVGGGCLDGSKRGGVADTSAADTAAPAADSAAPDTTTPSDSAVTGDTAPASDVVVGPPSRDPLTCALAHETCSGLMGRTCYFGDGCEGLPDCPISGCGSGGPEIDWVLFGWDLCQAPWVVLGDASGRLETTEITGDAPYLSPIRFTVLLDGAPTTTCELFELPTGAIRYQLSCFNAAGTLEFAAVLEDFEQGCPECPEVGGCYALEGADVLCAQLGTCPTPPTRLFIEPSGRCAARVLLEGPLLAEPLPAWVSHDGVLTLGRRWDVSAPSCSFPPTDGGGLGPAVCTLRAADGSVSTVTGVSKLTPASAGSCAIPECVLVETCEAAEIGDDCTNGVCTCGAGPACTLPLVCGVKADGQPGCVHETLWKDPRACFSADDCQPCLAGQAPSCCDEILDGSALDAVNTLHACPTCCSCSQPCTGVSIPKSVTCTGGQCRYEW